MHTLSRGQDYLQNANDITGFNAFVGGVEENEVNNLQLGGYWFAKNLARKGEIAFTHRFLCSCGHWPIRYGGFWCCNGCGKKSVDKPWWTIIVEKDGNMFCCHGLAFQNLQESENYAFGETFEIAIKNYGLKMIEKDGE